MSKTWRQNCTRQGFEQCPLCGGLDEIGLVATGNWRDPRSARRYAHAVVAWGMEQKCCRRSVVENPWSPADETANWLFFFESPSPPPKVRPQHFCSREIWWGARQQM